MFAQFNLPISAGECEIFHGYRTYITKPTIESEAILTIWPDLRRKTGLKRTVRIGIAANNPHLHNFISKSLLGRVKSFMDSRTYITMPTIESGADFNNMA